jgi:DNA polymerase-3 subunit alpha
MSFVPLHIYSGFSYLRSGLVASKIPAIASKLGYKAVGLSDVGTLSGYAPFTHAALRLGVKPLYLMDAEVNEGCFSLLASNEKGYRNLLVLTFLASQKKLTLEEIKQHHDGLFIIYDGNSPYLFALHNEKSEDEIASSLSSSFNGLGDVIFGLPYSSESNDYIGWIRNFASGHSYKLLAFPRILYYRENDAIVTLITKAINDKETLKEKNLAGDEYFLPPDVIAKYYSQEEIDLSSSLADACNVTFIQKRGSLIHFQNPLGLSSEDYLKKVAYEGLTKRYPNYPNEYALRLNYELGIIDKMGYADYFLVVADYVNYAKTHDISVGPGRGSGPASLVAYSLSISEPDPIKNGLLFERFLNPERQSMPDIDVDFSDRNRDKVASYLQEKYGEDKVGHVLTTQTIGAKESLRDIARVYGYEEREIELIISTIVNDKLSLRDDYRHSPQFKKLIDSDKYYLEIVSLASKIEGLPRQAGLHAAGVILNNEPLPSVMPTKEEEGIGYVGCLEKDYLEEQGFLKMDLLGLRNLSIIDDCFALVKENKGISLSYSSLPYDDAPSIALIKQGMVMGLFQLESAGMKKAIKEVEPTSFEDVSALLALFRPGPMESIPSYARRKKGLEKITYIDPDLEPILKGTYGIIVYQEQIMQITQKEAGFSLGEADLFRRAISHKDAAKLASYQTKFIAGCLKNGKSQAIANSLFSLIYKFANYGFNKAHAISYGMLTCQMAYLKKHYPEEFYCAILNSMSVGDSKYKNTLSELKTLAISLKNPDINLSGRNYSLKDKNIILPLSTIKNLQGSFIDAIIDERLLNGAYSDIFSFALRLKKYSLNLNSLIRLIDAGAFDSLEANRASLRASAPAAMNYAELLAGSDGKQALLTLGIEKPALVNAIDSKKEDLEAEYEALGMMVSGSPLSFYKAKIEQAKTIPLSEIDEEQAPFLTAGLVKSARAIVTRKGKQMCFLDLYDDVSEASFILWSEEYAKYFSLLKDEAPLLVKARPDGRGQGYIVMEVTSLGE